MNINMVAIPVQVSFWVMKEPTDGVIMANKWLTAPLQASLAWCEEVQSQVLYFKIPTAPLPAEGRAIKIPDRMGTGPTNKAQLTAEKEEASEGRNKDEHNELQEKTTEEVKPNRRRKTSTTRATTTRTRD